MYQYNLSVCQKMESGIAENSNLIKCFFAGDFASFRINEHPYAGMAVAHTNA